MLDVCQWPLRRNRIFVFEYKNTRILSEKSVDVFKRTVCSFWVEKVDDRYKRCVENSPDDVELPVKVLDTNGCNFDDLDIYALDLVSTQLRRKVRYHEVECPVRGCSQGSALGSHRQRIDLCWVKPRNPLKSDAKAYVIAFDVLSSAAMYSITREQY